MIRLPFILLMTILVSPVSAQPPILWEQFYGEYESKTYLYDLDDFPDNRFLITGSTDMFTWFSDVFLSVTDSLGNVIANKELGGDDIDLARANIKTIDNLYIFLGSTRSNDGDVSGNHGGYDMWAGAVDSALNLQWQLCLGGSGDEDGYDIMEIASGQYVAVGVTSSNNGNVSGNHGLEDIWLVSFTSEGTILWQRCLGGQNDERAFDLLYLEDGGFMVAGYTVSEDGDVTGNHGQTDAWVIRLDINGAIIWQKCFGGSLKENAMQLGKLSNGYYAFTGSVGSSDGDVAVNHGLSDLWLVIFDGDGNLISEKTFGTSYGETGLILLTDNEEILIAGSYWDGSRWLLKTDNLGDLIWEEIHQPFDDGSNHTTALMHAANDDFVGGGFFIPDCCVEAVSTIFRYSSNISTHSLDLNAEQTDPPEIYPNPNYGEFTVSSASSSTLEIFNTLGQPVFRAQFEDGIKKEISVILQHTGVYFLRFSNVNGLSQTRTVTILEN